MKKRHLLFIGAIALVFATGCARPDSYAEAAAFIPAADGSFDRTLNVSGVVYLDISTGSGGIEVRQGSENRVEVHGKIRASGNWFLSDRGTDAAIRSIESNPPIEQSGQTFRIGRILDRELERHVSISYEIVVPAQSNVRAHTGSGSMTVEGIVGRVEAGTGSGGMTLRNIKGDLRANTGSGGIHATGVRGGLRMETGSGVIDVEGEQTAEWVLQTGSGGVDVRLPRTASFDLSAHTGSGGISVDFPLTLKGRIDSSRHDVSGKVGSGDYRLSVHTGSGHIRID